MNRALRYLLPLGVFVLLVGFLAIGLKLDPREVPSPLIGKPAPAFKLPLLSDPARTLSVQELQGKVWVLNVWASWCEPCRAEHPTITELARTGGVPVYGLNYKDKAPDAKNWLARLGDPFAATLSDSDGLVGIDYGVYGVPETYIVDAKGVIRLKHIGPVTPDVLKERLLPMLAQLKKPDA